MGVVSDYIKKKLEQDIRTKGLLVWLDKENDYSSLVDQWIEQKKDGRFRYDIFAFRGSFLELMVESKEVLSGRDMPKCVIHMAGFNEQEIKATPVLEAYRAGQRWRASLPTMIREAAQGRLSEDQIRFLLSKENLTLSMADEYITNEELIPKEIKNILQKYGEDGFVLEFLKHPAKINKELCLEPEKCFPLLLDYFDKLVGLDSQWQVDWSQNQVDYAHPVDQADLLAAYLMAMEFVHDLRIDPSSERLKRLKKKQKEYAKKSSALLHEFRQNDPKRYIDLAAQVEANLTRQECLQSPKDLGSLDTFRFEADIFLNEAMILLNKEAWTDALELARVRLPGGRKGNVANTFWLQQDRERLWLWEWIEVASRLGMLANQVSEVVKTQNPDKLTHETLMAVYAKTWWELDQVHRRFSTFSERYQSTHTDLHIKPFIEIRKQLHTLYRQCIDEQSRLWNRLCEVAGFLPETSLQQRYFFKNRIKPLLEQSKKTAVFFVDSLRYELGKELLEELSSVCTRQELYGMLAELPTITAVGMNVLVPVVSDSGLVPLFNPKGEIVGFKGGVRQVKSAMDRHKTLQDHVGNETGWLTMSDLLSFSDRKLKNSLAKEVLVVTALDLDKMGESGALGFGIDYFERFLARLKTAVIKLREKGFEEFIITADHGFILGDESLETGKAPKLESAERRYALGSERNSDHLVSASANQLHYSGAIPNKWFVFERTTHLLVNQSRTGFYHGGNTLQERMVPVLSLSLTKDLPDHSGKFRLTIQKKPGVMGFHRVSIFPESMEPGLFSEPRIDIQLSSDDGVVVEIGDVIEAHRKGDVLTLPLQKESEIFFKLRGGNRSKATISFKPIQQNTQLFNADCPDYFEVSHQLPNMENETSKKNKPKAKERKTGYPDSIPDEFHTALAHLEKHGTLTEKFLVNTLGSGGAAARKGRRFANKISEWVNELPFDVCIEQTAEGKEYRKI